MAEPAAGRTKAVPERAIGRRAEQVSADPRIRICHCIHSLDLGGAQQIVRFLVDRVDRDCFRHVVYTAQDGVFRKEVERSGAIVRLVPRRLRKLDPWHVRRLAREMSRDDPAVVHTHLFGDSLHGYLAAKRAGGVPVLMTLHSDQRSLPTLQRLGYRWLLERVAGTVACSDSVRDSFLAAWGSEAESILSIPNGIEAPAGRRPDPATRQRLRQRLGLDSEAVIIASIGRLEESKALHHLIEAFGRLVRSVSPRPRLLFLGEGSLRDRLRLQAEREGVADQVLFAGFRPDVTELLPVLDVVAFSSLSEGLSIAMLEAMATARCIVGTDVPGITQAIRDEREGLVVPVGDVGRLAEALERAVTTAQLRRRLGAAAQRRFRERFRVERMISRYQELYTEILGRSIGAGHGTGREG